MEGKLEHTTTDSNAELQRRRDTAPAPLMGIDQLFDALFGWPLVMPKLYRDLHQDMGTVKEEENGYTLQMKIPDVEEKDIALTYDAKSGMLHVVAQKDEKHRMMRLERHEYLPGIDGQAVTSAYKDGVFSATLPKKTPTPHA